MSRRMPKRLTNPETLHSAVLTRVKGTYPARYYVSLYTFDEKRGHEVSSLSPDGTLKAKDALAVAQDWVRPLSSTPVEK